MGRKRLSDEQIIEKYGTKEQYEKHLEAMRKWYQEHPSRNKEYYRQNRRREIERTLKYRDEHPYYYDEQKQRAHNKIHNDPIARERNKLRSSSRILADRIGIDRTGKELHHFEPMSRKNFIVLDKEKHRWLHYVLGGRNIMVDLTAIKELLPMLGDVVLVKDGKISNWEDQQ
jgi:hypothetical protein